MVSGQNLERMYKLSAGTKKTARNNGLSLSSGCPTVSVSLVSGWSTVSVKWKYDLDNECKWLRINALKT